MKAKAKTAFTVLYDHDAVTIWEGERAGNYETISREQQGYSLIYAGGRIVGLTIHEIIRWKQETLLPLLRGTFGTDPDPVAALASVPELGQFPALRTNAARA